MIPAMVAVGILLLIFSLYRVFIANDAVTLSASLLRVMVTLIGLIALRFQDLLVLTSAVFLYAVISLFVLAVARKEVQIRHD